MSEEKKTCGCSGVYTSENHRDSQRCAFDDNGIFIKDNYCCETALALRNKFGQNHVTFSGNETLQSIPIGQNYEEAFLLIGVYKNRGCTQSLRILYGTKIKDLTYELAQDILNDADELRIKRS
jgi:hypothetical protein